MDSRQKRFFFHVHILDRILNSGFDIFVLDLRRCGRSKFDVDGVTPCVEDMLLGHDSYDFSEYLEEMDVAISFLKTPASNEQRHSRLKSIIAHKRNRLR